MEIPAPVVVAEKKGFLWTNIHAVAAACGRPVDHLAMFIVHALRCQVQVYPTYAAFPAPCSPIELIQAYIEQTMRCASCKALARGPDGICTACGAVGTVLPEELSLNILTVLD